MSYWLRAAIILATGAVVGERVAGFDVWDDLRYKVYQWQEQLGPRKPYVRNTAVIMIGDAEYWGEELAGRAPLRRDYLARLVEALDSLDAAVIALDFDLRSPFPDGRAIDEAAYQTETARLLSAVDVVSARRPVVLPKTIALSGRAGFYVLESDVFDRYRFKSNRVLNGYIALVSDFRNVPTALPLHPRGAIDSLAEAIVRAYNVKALRTLRVPGTPLPFGSYLPSSDFPIISASAVLAGTGTGLADQVAHKIVLLGGNWHVRAFGRGPMCDAYLTPAGVLPGVVVHANYVEALLDGRIYWPMEGLSRVLEWTLVMVLVVSLGLDSKRRWHMLALLCLLALAVSYVCLRNFGRFFNFGFPVALLLAHQGTERVLEWRQAYKERKNGD